MSTPTYFLPPCPVCSTLLTLERPVWRFSHNTSAKRGCHCYTLQACKHVAEVADLMEVRHDPADWARVEAAWKDRAQKLWIDRTAGWTVQAIDGLRTAIFNASGYDFTATTK